MQSLLRINRGDQVSMSALEMKDSFLFEVDGSREVAESDLAGARHRIHLTRIMV
jgi:hypothetical protein